jgi:hypothetical protein
MGMLQSSSLLDSVESAAWSLQDVKQNAKKMANRENKNFFIKTPKI